jgi:multidrug efflux pump subunit AcrB
MEWIRECVARWIEGRTPAEIAATAAGAIAIAVVPGSLVLWLAWRLLRPRAFVQE